MRKKRDRSRRVDKEIHNFADIINGKLKETETNGDYNLSTLGRDYAIYLNREEPYSDSYMSKVLARNQLCWNRKTKQIVHLGTVLPDTINIYNRLFHIFIAVQDISTRNHLKKWLYSNEILSEGLLTVFSNEDGLLVLSKDPQFYSKFTLEYEELPSE